MYPDATDLFGPELAERGFTLRQQRALLGTLRDEVQATCGRLAVGSATMGWRSSAQRAYSDRVNTLIAHLQTVLRQLDNALMAVNAALARIAAGP